jgi:serine O-acetyltransferase
VLGGFTVGDNARIGSNAVVTQAGAPGATAVGNPARIIQAEAGAAREATAAKMGFSAYGLTPRRRPAVAGDEGPDRQRLVGTSTRSRCSGRRSRS